MKAKITFHEIEIQQPTTLPTEVVEYDLENKEDVLAMQKAIVKAVQQGRLMATETIE